MSNPKVPIVRLSVVTALMGGAVLGAPVILTLTLTPTVAVAGPKAASMKVATIPVAGMTCGGCASNVTGVLDDLDGVTKSSVDLKKAQAVVHFDSKRTKIKQIVAAIKSVGYDPGKPVVKDA